MKCPSCSRPNRDERRFCAECGSPIGSCCGRCGFSNRPDERYCGGCGIQLGADLPSAETRRASGSQAPAASKNILSAEAVKELKAIREKAAQKPTEEKPAVSQDDIDKMFQNG